MNESDSMQKSEEITPAEAAQLFFCSFRFSQGLVDLQRNFLEHVYRTRTPVWTMQQKTHDAAKKIAEKKTFAIAKNPYLHTEISLSEMQGEVDRQFKEMQELFRSEELYLYESQVKDSIESITSLTIHCDYEYLTKKEGRPRVSSESNKVNAVYADKFLSYICHFGIHGNHAGHVLFDNVFKDIRRRVIALRKGEEEHVIEEDEEMLSTVINVYNKHHPDTPVSC